VDYLFAGLILIGKLQAFSECWLYRLLLLPLFYWYDAWRVVNQSINQSIIYLFVKQWFQCQVSSV